MFKIDLEIFTIYHSLLNLFKQDNFEKKIIKISFYSTKFIDDILLFFCIISSLVELVFRKYMDYGDFFFRN